MNQRLRKTLGIALLSCFTLCGCLGIAACNGGAADHPDFINPDDGGNAPVVPDTSNKYIISIVSKGGLSLDGVEVTASQNGTTVKTGISIGGKVELSIPDGEYDLSFDNLPNGYLLGDTQYKLTAEDKTLTATFESKVIRTTASSSFSYSVGDVMYDFSFKDCDGNTHVLSNLVENNKAVILNFFYKDCSPCRSEFPAMQAAYNAYANKATIVALSDRDSLNKISQFREEMSTRQNNPVDLTFPMGSDSANVNDLFNVTAFPTTVVVDRYGVVAAVHSGAITSEAEWKSIFDTYTSDDYVQKDTEEEEDNPGDTGEADRTKPNVTPSTSDEIQAALGLNGTYYPEETDEYSWPWIVKYDEDGGFITASNTGVNNSYAILYTDISLNEGDTIVYDYNVSTESGYDILYVLVNRDDAAAYSGDSNGWKTERLYIANRAETVNLSFCFLKDEQSAEGTDTASIRNLRIESAYTSNATFDARRDAAVDPLADKSGYATYKQVRLSEDDGFYHVVNDDGSLGAILLADLQNVTPWTTLHFKSNIKFNSQYNVEYYNALYHIAYWEMATGKGSSDEKDLGFTFNGVNYSELVIDAYYMQMFSDNGLVPVSARLKDCIDDFLTEYCTKNKMAIYPEQWLELCFYYDHYGDAHQDGKCSVNNDPCKGMTKENALIAQLGTNTADVYRPLQTNRGVRFNFTAPTAGVYRIASLAEDTTVDPFLFIRNENGTVLQAVDDVREYDKFVKNYHYNFSAYLYLEEGETTYLSLALSMPGDTGLYDFEISYLGASAEILLMCTTGDGLWSYDEVTGSLYYLAIKTTLNDDGTYYAVTQNNELGSKIYVDFVRPNYFDANGHTLLEIIQEGLFDFTDLGGMDYTQTMLTFYYRSIQGKAVTDADYGLIEATEELVAILDFLILVNQEEGSASNAWLQFACYYEYFGPAISE